MGHAYLTPSQLPNADASKVFAEFSLHPKQNQAKTVEAGRPIFDEVEYVRIVVPGDRDEVHRPAREQDRANFPAQYAAFKAQTSQEAVSGTPLASVPFINRAMVAELAVFNCRTVEQLAAMPDAAAQRFSGIQELKRQATDFLAAAAGAAPLEQARAENAQLKSRLEALEAAVAKQNAAHGKSKQ